MKVRDVLSRLRGQHVALLPNNGNCGDGLILMGLRRLCAEFRVSTTELRHPFPARGTTLLALACGNLCRPYHSAIERIQYYAGGFRQLVILPCSVDPACDEVAEFMRSLPEQTLFFCRERQSYRLVEPLLADRSRLHLDHDLAFAADYAPWQRPGRGNLSAFRSDGESAAAPPPGNVDVSMWGGEWKGECLLDVVSAVASVHTDHVHVAIAGAMLGKETHLYATSYHKVAAMYDYSLSQRSNVFFHRRGHESAPPTDSPHVYAWRDAASAWLDRRVTEGFSA